MRSPLMVPLVLLTLMLLLTVGEAALRSKITNDKSGKVRAEKGGMRTVEGAQSRGEKMTDKRVPAVFSNEVLEEGKELRTGVQAEERVPRVGEEVQEERRVPDVGEEVPEDVVRIKDEKVLHAVESNLLALLGLHRRPRLSKKIVIPDAMKELYRRQTGMDLDTTNFHLPGRHTASANVVRSFTHQESQADEQFRNQQRFRLSFAVDAIPKSERLQVAELQLSASGAHHILVHDIVRPGVRGRREPITRLIDSRRLKASGGRIVLDVTPAVKRWLANPEDNHGLLVVVQEGNGRVRLKRDVDDVDEWREVQPLLYMYTDDGKGNNPVPLAKRARRAVRKHKRKDGRELCRRHQLYVDFKEVGWNDWIVAPEGYNAYYCAGDCPFPQSDHLNSTNHAIVQTLVNSVFPSVAPKACCVPTTLSSVLMLYLDKDESVVLKSYHDMTIEGCGCR